MHTTGQRFLLTHHHLDVFTIYHAMALPATIFAKTGMQQAYDYRYPHRHHPVKV
jgi:hypothetical protein